MTSFCRAMSWVIPASPRSTVFSRNSSVGSLGARPLLPGLSVDELAIEGHVLLQFADVLQLLRPIRGTLQVCGKQMLNDLNRLRLLAVAQAAVQKHSGGFLRARAFELRFKHLELGLSVAGSCGLLELILTHFARLLEVRRPEGLQLFGRCADSDEHFVARSEHPRIVSRSAFLVDLLLDGVEEKLCFFPRVELFAEVAEEVIGRLIDACSPPL